MKTITTDNGEKYIDLTPEYVSYDCVIAMDSLREGSKGWKIFDYSKDKKYINQKEDLKKRLFPIALVGDFGVGKSLIHAGICGGNTWNTHLPSGNIISTRGISMKRLDLGKNGLHEVLDFQGFETPLKFADREKQVLKSIHFPDENPIHKLLLDRKRDEEFLYQIALRAANVFVVVVNDLTRHQQCLIEEIKESVGGKQLYVIHNWKSVMTSIEYLAKIETECKEVYPGHCVNQNQLYIHFEDGSNEDDIDSGGVVHFFLANKDCEFGKRVNEKCFLRIRTMLASHRPQKNEGFLKRIQKRADSLLVQWVQNVNPKKPTQIVIGGKTRTSKKVTYVVQSNQLNRSNKKKKKKKREKSLMFPENSTTSHSGPYQIIEPDGYIRLNLKKVNEPYVQKRSKKKKKFRLKKILRRKSPQLKFSYTPASRFGGLSSVCGNLDVPMDVFSGHKLIKGEKRECLVVQVDVPGLKTKSKTGDNMMNKRVVNWPPGMTDDVKVSSKTITNGNHRYLEISVARTSVLRKYENSKITTIHKRGRGSGRTVKQVEIPLKYNFEDEEVFQKDGEYMVVFKLADTASQRVLQTGRFFEESEENDGAELVCGRTGVLEEPVEESEDEDMNEYIYGVTGADIYPSPMRLGLRLEGSKSPSDSDSGI